MPVLSATAWYHSGEKAPLFEGLNVFHFPITTKSKLAQQYFNQRLVLAYAFNHAEAGLEADNCARAYKAVQKALTLSSGTTNKKKALIQALSKRYTKNIVEHRTSLDAA